jgi:hypothetical protein
MYSASFECQFRWLTFSCRTNSLLNMLMINAVNRGMLTAFTAALHIILVSLYLPRNLLLTFVPVPLVSKQFLVWSGSRSERKTCVAVRAVYLPVLTGTVYMNSMLATLNTREHIRQSIQENSVGRISVSLGNLSSSPSSGPTIPQIPANTTIDMSSLNGHNSHVRSTEFIFSNA